jgi:rubrerythrin
MAKNSIISGCMKVERAASRLYKKIAKKFPDDNEFWQDLSDDEVNHLSFLKDVHSFGLTEVMKKTDALPRMKYIDEALNIAEDLTSKIKSNSVSFKKVLAMTLKLEESMAEMYTNRVIAKLLSCEDEASYKKTVADEKKHINKIKRMMNKR